MLHRTLALLLCLSPLLSLAKEAKEKAPSAVQQFNAQLAELTTNSELVSSELAGQAAIDAAQVLFNKSTFAYTPSQTDRYALHKDDAGWNDLGMEDIKQQFLPALLTQMGRQAAEVKLLPLVDENELKELYSMNDQLRAHPEQVVKMRLILKEFAAQEQTIIRYGYDRHAVYALLAANNLLKPSVSLQAKLSDYYLRFGWAPALISTAVGMKVLSNAAEHPIARSLRNEIAAAFNSQNGYRDSEDIYDITRKELNAEMSNKAFARMKVSFDCSVGEIKALTDPVSKKDKVLHNVAEEFSKQANSYTKTVSKREYKPVSQPLSNLDDEDQFEQMVKPTQESISNYRTAMQDIAKSAWNVDGSLARIQAECANGVGIWKRQEILGPLGAKTLVGVGLVAAPWITWLSRLPGHKDIRARYHYMQTVEREMHRELMRMKKFILVMQQMYQLIMLEVSAVRETAAYKQLHRWFNTTDAQHAPAITSLLTLLDKPLFKDYDGGSIKPDFVRFDQLYEAMKLLQGALPGITECAAAMGMIDAHLLPLTIVQYKLPHANTWCVPTLVFDGSPVLEVQDGQQILVPDSVQNSINLGSTDARILLITGPNGSGKTTLMRTLASCAILGQSLGIAPARSMRLAPFAYVGTSKDIQDAIMQNASRFAAELRTIEGLKARVKDIGSSKFAFLFIDEPYSGTTEGVGAHFTKQLIDELCYIFPNVISCIASHHHLEFDKLPGTTLGHMEVVHHGGINFTLTFRYLPNIADWWYAGGATLQGQFAEFFLRRQFAAIKNKVVETVVAATNDAAALATADKDEAIKA